MESRDETLLNIAAVCHEGNRMFCLTLGDLSQPDWMQAPDWQRSSAIKGVEAIADGRTTRPEQSHESWSAEKVAAGWVYGSVKDPEMRVHPCLVPFADLPPAQQTKDHLFFAIASTLLARAGLLRVKPVPETVQDEKARELYVAANLSRSEIKVVATEVERLRNISVAVARFGGVSGEVPANATLAYRHLEDASMRLGKVMQALDGGVSVYDRATTVGA